MTPRLRLARGSFTAWGMQRTWSAKWALLAGVLVVAGCGGASTRAGAGGAQRTRAAAASAGASERGTGSSGGEVLGRHGGRGNTGAVAHAAPTVMYYCLAVPAGSADLGAGTALGRIDDAGEAGEAGDGACLGLFTDEAVARATRDALVAAGKRGWSVATPRALAPPVSARLAAARPVFVGAPLAVRVHGSGAFLEVSHASGRDALAVFHRGGGDAPAPGSLLVLDAPTGRALRAEAWDYAFVPDGSAVVCSRDVEVVDARHVDSVGYRRHHIPEVARREGIDPAVLEEVAFQEGFSGGLHASVVDRIDLATGETHPLHLVGGGTLWTKDGAIYGLPQPWHWVLHPNNLGTAHAVPRPLELALAGRPRWRSVEGIDARDAALHARRDAHAGRIVGHLPSEWTTVGSVAAETEDHRLGVVVVAPGPLVAPARLPPSPTGRVEQ